MEAEEKALSHEWHRT